MSMQTETRHTEVRKPGSFQEKEVTTETTVTEKPSNSKVTPGVKPNTTLHARRRSSFSEQAQQLIPNVSKQQLVYGLPVVLAILLALSLLWFKSSLIHQPIPEPPTTSTSQQFANKMDSFGSAVGGEFYNSLKHKATDLSRSATEFTSSLSTHPSVETMKKKAEELKAEVDRFLSSAGEKASEYAEQAKKVAGQAGAKVDELKEEGGAAYDRASLHGQGIGETVRHVVNEATESVRHAAAETQESIRHRAATAQNTASQKVQDVKDTIHNIKDTVHNIKDTIKEKL